MDRVRRSALGFTYSRVGDVAIIHRGDYVIYMRVGRKIKFPMRELQVARWFSQKISAI